VVASASAPRNLLGHGVKTLYIEPGGPWETRYCESFNSTLRDELLAREIFYKMKEARTLIEWWRRHYNTARPHSSLVYKPPSPKEELANAVHADLRSGRGGVTATLKPAKSNY